MNRFLRSIWFGLLAVTAVVTTGCSKDDPIPPTPNPTIKISDVKATSSSVTFTLTATEAAKYTYTVALKGQSGSPVVVEGKLSSTEKVENLEADKAYVITATAQAADGTKSKTETHEFVTNPKASVVIGEVTAKARKATVTLTPTNAVKFFYVYYATAQKPTDLEWIEKEGNDPLKVEMTDLTPETDYTIEAYATNAEGASATVTKAFKTAVMPAPLTVTMAPTSQVVAAYFDLDKPQASGYYSSGLIDLSDEFNDIKTIEDFLNDLKNNDWKYTRESESKWMQLYGQPGKSFVLFTVCANVDGPMVETATEIEVTLPAQDKTKTGAATVTINSLTPGSTTAKANVKFSDNTVMYITGKVAKESAATGIVTYVNMNLSTFSPMLVDPTEALDIEMAGLNPETEFYFFAVAIDNQGKYGEVISQTFKTSAVVPDEKVTVDLAVTSKSFENTVFKVTTKGDPAKLRMRMISSADFEFQHNNNEEEIKLALYDPFADEMTLDGDVYTAFNLQYNTNYILFVMPVKADGSVGVFKRLDFTSYKFEPTGNAQASAEFLRKETKTFNEGTDKEWKITYAYYMVTPGADCARCRFSAVDNEMYGIWSADMGGYMLVNAYEEVSEPTEVEVQMSGDTYFTLLPYDAEGNYSAPVVCPVVTWTDPNAK